MKVTEHWLREWVDYDLKPDALAALLTMGGLEVDAVAPAAGTFEGVIVAQVVETRAHPEADKLTLCQVDAGTGQLFQVVCGAANVRPKLKVALAQVGATLPNGFCIKEVKLRGEPSLGMLCSTQELGMAESSNGILELDEDAPIGVSLDEYLNLKDHIFDIDLTPNRADCLSIKGVAREIATKMNVPLKQFEIPEIKPKHSNTLSVTVQAVEACPLYAGCLIQKIRTDAITPLWMRERLRRVGIRPVHPVVDVTQFVMMELGQPMHAFDAKSIQGGMIVRHSQAGESLTLLDGQTVEFNEPVLLIADEQGPLAMAGVMGGEASAVHEGTVDVFLESAFFSPSAITGVARRHGFVTDASYRYERGVDPLLPHLALARAVQLLQEIVGGTVGPVVTIKQKSPWLSPKQVVFRPEQVLKRVGIIIEPLRMRTILQSLGFTFLKEVKEAWVLEVPSYRFDIHIEEDIIEEVIRITGYDTIPALASSAELRSPQVSWIDLAEQETGEFFAALGYNETISYSFIDPRVREALFPDALTLSLANPLSSELSEMRVSLWPGLLASALYNLNRQQSLIALYECGRVFDRTSGTLQERPQIAALLTGVKGELDWKAQASPFDFYDLKGDIEALFKHLKLQVKFEAQSHPALHPGKSAALRLNDALIGWCGVLHPQIAESLDLETEIMLFECQLEAVTQAAAVHYTPISKYPQIRRDLAFLVDTSVEYGQIEAAIKSVDDKGILKSFHVFDIYIGKGIEKGKQSLAIAFYMQSESRTLVDAEINAYLDAMIKKLEITLAMSLRDGT